MVGVMDEEQVEEEQQAQQHHGANVKENGDDGRALHEVDPVLHQPVKAFQEQKNREQGDKSRRKVVPAECVYERCNE